LTNHAGVKRADTGETIGDEYMGISMETGVKALESLLIEQGTIEASTVEDYAHRVNEEWLPTRGARLCAKAWVDQTFKERLLADGKAAAESLGFWLPEHHGSLVVKENTGDVHNVVCCSLCSCTAFTILGLAPGWYKDLEYRARIVREARSVLREMGLSLPETIKIRVWDTTADTRYMVLPKRPGGTENWTEDQLVELITQDDLIGVARTEMRHAEDSLSSQGAR
jgi:nitrile hydratase